MVVKVEVCPVGRKKKDMPPGGMSFISGVPETIRTSGLLLRRESLYPAELRGQEMILIA